jgi:DNA-binding response OmpR family regulator
MENPRILLVDDEAALTDLLKRYLERLGYHVDACGDAGTALAWADKAPGRYALVIADLTLPDMNGADLVAKLRRNNPGFRALITSGYPYQSSAEGMEFLQKPFLPKMLAEAIERTLAR